VMGGCRPGQFGRRRVFPCAMSASRRLAPDTQAPTHDGPRPRPRQRRPDIRARPTGPRPPLNDASSHARCHPSTGNRCHGARTRHMVGARHARPARGAPARGSAPAAHPRGAGAPSCAPWRAEGVGTRSVPPHRRNALAARRRTRSNRFRFPDYRAAPTVAGPPKGTAGNYALIPRLSWFVATGCSSTPGRRRAAPSGAAACRRPGRAPPFRCRRA
jgi:hypothetical protein